MELLLELLVEIVGQVVFEALFEWIGRATGKGIESRRKRRVLHWTFSIGAVAAVGLWWGIRAGSSGRMATPGAVWVSVGLAAFTGLMAWRESAKRAEEVPSHLPEPDRHAETGWGTPGWWGRLSAMSVAAAITVALGFQASKP